METIYSLSHNLAYQKSTSDDGKTVKVFDDKDKLLATFPLPFVPWTTFRRQIQFGVSRIHASETPGVQIFYDERIPGWEVVTFGAAAHCQVGGLNRTEWPRLLTQRRWNQTITLHVQSGGMASVMHHPRVFTDRIKKEIPRFWLFRFLSLFRENCVQEYVQRFPKNKKIMRLCKYLVRVWIGSLLQAYHNVMVHKTQTLSSSQPYPVAQLDRDVFRTRNEHVTYATTESWFKEKCPEETFSLLTL